jgi:hypothetical protein
MRLSQKPALNASPPEPFDTAKVTLRDAVCFTSGLPRILHIPRETSGFRRTARPTLGVIE